MQNKTFRLFISSPFSDFTKEREVLHKRVFPKIEEYCNQHHLSFQPVDLRWGVNEEAQLDQKTLELCLEEVRACKHFPHPNFLIMAGDRYGYVPCPYMIEKSEFEDIYNYVKDHNRNIEIEYGEHKKEKYPKVYGESVEGKVTAPNRKTNSIELLEQWYQLDENQLPASYILQERIDDKKYGNYLIYENWAPEENSLRDILQEAADHIFKSKESKEYQKYFLSATEQEVIEGIYDYKYKTDVQKDRDGAIDKKYIFGYTRSIEKNDDSEDNQIYLDRQGKKSVPELKVKADRFKTDLQKLLKDNVFPYSLTSVKEYNDNELIKFEEYIREKLKSAINEQLPKIENLTKKEEQKLKLAQEISEQTKFLKDKVKGFQGREKTLGAIGSYLKEATTEPLIIHGPSGMGKSSLMSEAVFRTDINRDKENIKIETDALFRFVGATANSTIIRSLLISIVDELQDKNIIEQVEQYEVDDKKFDTQIKDILLSIEKKTETTVTIFIDAMDQLQYKNYLNWLPGKLPSNLKIILTVLNDEKYEEDTHYYNLLIERYDNTKFIDITNDSLEEKKEDLIIDLLKTENRQLDEHQTNYLLERWKKTNYSPLYLKIAIEEVKHWKAGDTSQTLSDCIEGIITEYLENLKKLYHHEELLIKKVFGYIHASKDGLSEKELLEILSEDLEDEDEFRKVIINEYHEAIKVTNPRREGKEEHILPISIWSRLHTQIKPFIIERNIDGQPLMKFFHRQFTTVVEKYIEDDKTLFYEKLEEYYRRYSFDIMVKEEGSSKLELKNFIYHLKQQGKYEKLELLRIMFEKEIDSLYKNNYIELIQIYDFDSEVPEVKKLQGMRYILKSCFIKEDKRYRQKQFQDIDISTEDLDDYKINNFYEEYENMINLVGKINFIAQEPQIIDLDNVLWNKEYSYNQIILGLKGSPYTEFSYHKYDEIFGSEGIHTRECNVCNNIRLFDQLIPSGQYKICKKCLVDQCETHIGLKEWLIEIGYGLGYCSEDIFNDEYDEWKSNIEDELEDEYNCFNQSLIDSNQPTITWNFYKEEFDTELIKKSHYDYYSYMENELKLKNIEDIKWEDYGFKDD